MNQTAAILDYLAKCETPCVVLLAPNAPPVRRTERGVEVALNAVLDAASVADTLDGLAAKTDKGKLDFDENGTFCFGVPDVGRIRVSYATQRGSRIVSVANIPFRVPRLDDVCDDSSAANRLVKIVSSGQMGMLAVTGPSLLSNSMLVYALLQEVNQTKRSIIYILERRLTYLMAHADSIVIQSELGRDVKSLQEGLESASLFDPDTIFAGDIRLTDDLPGLRHAVASSIFAVVSSVSVTAEALFDRFCPKPGEGGVAARLYSRSKVNVLPAPGGKLSVTLVDMSPKNA